MSQDSNNKKEEKNKLELNGQEDQGMPTVERAKSANPFEQEENEPQEKKKSEAEKSNPTLENLTGEAPREEKLDRKETLKKFLKDNKQHEKDSTLKADEKNAN
jgi:hypothetical protein